MRRNLSLVTETNKFTGRADFNSVQRWDLSEEAELHVRGHGHGQTLRVQEVRGQPLWFQPHLVPSPGKPQHPRLDGGAVSTEDVDHFSEYQC